MSDDSIFIEHFSTDSELAAFVVTGEGAGSAFIPNTTVEGYVQAQTSFIVGSDQMADDSSTTDKDRRMFFDKLNGAFRAGETLNTAWDARGSNSTATGLDCVASGDNSVAMGNGCSATLGAAVAIGDRCMATGPNSLVLGSLGAANAEGAIAIGTSCNATAEDAIAIGESCTATFSNAIAIGHNSHSTAANTVALGLNCTASGTNAFALGLNCTAVGARSFVWNGSGAVYSHDDTGGVSFNCATGASFDVAFNDVTDTGDGASSKSRISGNTGYVWTHSSLRSTKENIVESNCTDILAKLVSLDIYNYNYIGQAATNVFIGPMADDWHPLFPSDRPTDSLTSRDLVGVALASIKGLKLETDVTVAATNTSVTTLSSSVTANTTSLVSQTTQIALLEAQNSAYEIRISTLESDMVEQNAIITNLENRLNALEGV